MVRKKLAGLKTWRARLDFAIENGISEEEKGFLHWKAGNWDCCAVGENRAALERAGVMFFQHGEPDVNNKTYDLGLEFCRSISHGNYVEAKKILSEIEQLSAKSR